MASKLIFSLIFILYFTDLQAQTHYYDIYKGGGDPIGSIQTTRTQSGNMTHIKANTEVSVRVLFKIDLVYLFNTTFVNGLFSKSDTKNTTNGNVREYSKVKWDGVKYQTEVNEKKKVVSLARAKYTTLSMYYQEPTNVREVFSERFATYCKLRPLGNRVYELTLPNGNKNHYKYQNGKCTEITAHTTMATLKFKLRS